MSALEVGLVTAVALLTIVVAALLRTLAATTRRIELVERRLQREQRQGARRQEPAAVPDPSGVAVPDRPGGTPVTPTMPPTPAAAAPEGDAVDVRGTDPEGQPTVVSLERSDQPTLLMFLSTSCGICVGLWERLRAGELAEEVPGVVPVVVTKDAAAEDVDRIRELSSAEAPVVLSTEAWDDYEVPGSPYVMLVSAAPGSVVTEGAVTRWQDVVTMATSSSNA